MGRLKEYLQSIFSKKKKNDNRIRVIEIMQEYCQTYPLHAQKVAFSHRTEFEQNEDWVTGDYYWFLHEIHIRLGEQKQAEDALNRCYQIRQRALGEDDWCTAIAGYECCRYKLMGGYNREAEAFIESFIRNIQNNRYQEQIDPDILSRMEGRALLIFLMTKGNQKQLKPYYSFITRYCELSAKYNEDPAEGALKNRLAYNEMGIYYLESGNLIRAEEAFEAALNTPIPEGAEVTLTDNEIRMNRIIVWGDMGELQKAYDEIQSLRSLYQESTVREGNKREYISLMSLLSLLLAKCEIEEDEYPVLLHDLKEFEKTAAWDIRSYEDQEIVQMQVHYVTAAVKHLLKYQNAISDLPYYYDVLKRMEALISSEILPETTQLLYYQLCALIGAELKDPYCLDAVERCIQILETIDISILGGDVEIINSICHVLFRYKKFDMAADYMEKALSKLSCTWESVITYANDQRLTGALWTAQQIFTSIYGMFRGIKRPAEAYEAILKYKRIASLALRERNRNLIRTGIMDSDLYHRLSMVQNQAAELEASDIFLYSVSDDAVAENRRKLEAEFEKLVSSCMENMQFTEISFDRVCMAMPNQTVLIEYYPFLNLETDALTLDVYILQKQNEKVSINRIEIPEAYTIMEAVSEFVWALQITSQKSGDNEAAERKEQLRSFLSEKLIAPVEGYLSGFETVYFASESGLENLPFEILLCQNNKFLNDLYSILRIECGRDFLFLNETQAESVNSSSLIIGNPNYDAGKSPVSGQEVNQQDQEEWERFKRMDQDEICALPFSEVEAEIVSDYCQAHCYSGEEASKNLLLNCQSPRNIHIATHGWYDLEEESDSFYSSCLLLAGSRTWLKSGTKDLVYGNGIITADEISRLQLYQTELVVLSACQSGMSSAMFSNSYQGLISAFSAAGVKYVITHLWSAADFPTAVFMDLFYYFYKQKQMDPPEALKMAKQTMRQMTIGELREKGWFDNSHRPPSAGQEYEQMIFYYSRLRDTIRPFRSEVYWAGFSCCICN